MQFDVVKNFEEGKLFDFEWSNFKMVWVVPAWTGSQVNRLLDGYEHGSPSGSGTGYSCSKESTYRY